MRTFEYRMRPNPVQEQALMSVLIASRKLYNDGLEELVSSYEETGKHMHLYEQDKNHGKAEHPDLPAVVVDTTLKRGSTVLDEAEAERKMKDHQIVQQQAVARQASKPAPQPVKKDAKEEFGEEFEEIG